MMTWPNPATRTELETHRDALDCKLQLLNPLIELHQHQGTIPGAVAESWLAGIEAAQGDSAALDTAMKHCRAAAAEVDGISK